LFAGKHGEEEYTNGIIMGEGFDLYSSAMASADESERINFLAGGLAGGSIGSGQGELRHAVASAARALDENSLPAATYSSESNGNPNKIKENEFIIQINGMTAFPSVLTMEGISDTDEYDGSNLKRAAAVMEHIPEVQESLHISLHTHNDNVSHDSKQDNHQTLLKRNDTPTINSIQSCNSRVDSDQIQQAQDEKTKLKHTQDSTTINSAQMIIMSPPIIQFRSKNTPSFLLLVSFAILVISTQSSCMCKLMQLKSFKKNGIFDPHIQTTNFSMVAISEETTAVKEQQRYTAQEQPFSKSNNVSDHVETVEPTKEEKTSTINFALTRGRTERVAFQSISSWAFDESIPWDIPLPPPPQQQDTSSPNPTFQFMHTAVKTRCSRIAAENLFQVWRAHYFVRTKTGKDIAHRETIKRMRHLIKS